MVRRKVFLALVCLLIQAGILVSAHAESNVALLDKKKRSGAGIIKSREASPVSLYVFSEKLKNVIAEVIRRDNISLKVEDSVNIRVEGKKLVGTRHAILKQLAGEFDFDWFEYNNTLYVSNKYERSTKFFAVNAASIRKYLLKLDEAGANMDAFQTQYIDKKTTSVSGPPGYIAIVSTIINSQSSKSKKVIRTDYNVNLYKGVKLHKIELDKEKN